jgi:hypothetical protein
MQVDPFFLKSVPKSRVPSYHEWSQVLPLDRIGWGDLMASRLLG